MVAWLRFAEAALWPLVVLVLCIVLRGPIGRFLGSLGGRVSKLSVLAVSVELAVTEPVNLPWQGYAGDDIRGLVVADQVNNSYFSTLQQALGRGDDADYLVVDLRRSDEEWLTSRLYLFGHLLSKLKGVRAVVFVATRDEVGRVFLACAQVDQVLRALGRAQPWLSRARLDLEDVLIDRRHPSPPRAAGVDPQPFDPGSKQPEAADADERWEATKAGTGGRDSLYLAQQFLLSLQRTIPEGTEPPEGWLQLPRQPGRPPIIEHATWLRIEDLTDGLLRDVVEPDAYVIDDPTWSAEERVRAVATREGQFVALLSPSRRFLRLVDREALLVALGEAAARAT
ncbi:hypothetical protein HP550_20300 [Cellulomonas humilata]|uniref:Uncharacterized protein n=1 Tax=Cellulomonas humilata TaxID=144055 RepID=A0A7Y6A5S2_9CELL|nr:hypothetical protein [Cellulomonas humilata]NUU19593.1 hypothetical protein [Cellulomonas humilata]